MIAQKKKGKIIELYRGEVNEIESFTLLIISQEEMNELIACSNSWETKGNKLISKYESNDDLDKKWKDIAVAHSKVANEFRDVSKVYKTDIYGTSMLIRDPGTHVIRIALRNGNKECTINKICLSDMRRDNFFADCKKSYYFNKNKKYAIDYHDEELYNYWSKYMNEAYKKGVNK